MNRERKFTPSDIVEGQLPVEEPQLPKVEHHPFLDRILHSQIVFEARKHLKRQSEKPNANGR